MKLNKWTVGLAAVGAISLASAVQAEETQMNVVNAMTSGTTISGYVSTDFSYDLNTAVDGVDRADALGSGKANGFNLDVVNLTIEKPLDESEWAAGYKAEFLFGPDASGVGTSLDPGAGSDFAIKQAYVNVRTPVGNGIDWKMGVFDTIIGYESFNANVDPNYTRSLGWSIEPTQHTGLLAAYQVSDIVSVTAGIAETTAPFINDRPSYTGANFTKDQFNLCYMGAVAVTAPEEAGPLAGSTFYGGVIYGRYGDTGNGGNQTSWYTGATLSTGVEGLSVGAAFDYLDQQDTVNTGGGNQTGSIWVAGIYASYQATEKLSLHARGEYGRGNSFYDPNPADETSFNHWEGTLTAQYDLWQNVISRLELRWDNVNYRGQTDQNGDTIGYGDSQQGPNLSNAYMIALNVIYQF